MKLFNRLFACIVLSLSVGCTRIETGEVGVRIGFDKQISPGELLPGSFNQTLIGSVLTFPVKDVSVRVEDMTPLAKDNSTMKDFDALVIYSINPQSVSELYVSKNRSFHAEHDGDIYLMYNYVHQTARNAIYKSARKYDALDMNDNRQAIETEVKDLMVHSLADEKLDSAITISQVLVRVILPADSVVASANDLVRAKNEYKQKEVEVQTAKKEAERIAALNANKGAIEYMSAMANMKIAEAIANGRVNTIVIPMDFKGMVNISK
ncbi:SPFH domain-containing protein [Bdellovibrio sp. HCB2-146]|uniref:SPFH domain-containing protein n=1 Tax=Bdellovibrio sp. HCB2-146 TaxID=3394362 RepID=UPI0039BCD095